MAKNWILSPIEQMTNFGKGHYRSLDPKEEKDLAAQIIQGRIDSPKWDDLKDMTSASLKIAIPEEEPPAILEDSPAPEETPVVSLATARAHLKEKLQSQHAIRTQVEEKAAQNQDVAQSLTTKFLVFRVLGRRYALSLQKLLGVGRIDGESWLRGRIEIRKGSFPLYDLKLALSQTGEAGNVYFIARAPEGSQLPGAAWAVDSIEGIQPLEISLARPMSSFGLAAAHGKNNRLIESVFTGPAGGAPIYLLDSEALF